MKLKLTQAQLDWALEVARKYEAGEYVISPKKCDQCGKTSEGVTTVIDPFALEEYNENVRMDLCNDCYDYRSWGR